MAKNKKTNNANQKLSPENYIRQKARNLPIYECWIDSNWKNSGLATICISRIHSNGNLTLGMYLVDLYCLGLKDTTYRFNFFRSDYNELIDDMKERQEMKKIEYSLAHNIIFAGIEYADELGFKPLKDFTTITQYILEEDNDNIELIEIECGHDGQPFFIQSENTSIAKTNSIINTLNKSVGKGNYKIILKNIMEEEFNNDEYDDEYNDDEYVDVLMNEYNKLSKHERIELFKLLTNNGLDDISDENRLQLISLTDSIYFVDLCDSEEVNKIYNSWSAEINVNIADKFFTWETLGLDSEREISEEETVDYLALDVFLNIKPKKLKKRIEEMRKKWGNIPYLDIIELHYLRLTNPKLFESKLIEQELKLKDYALFKMLKYRNLFFKTKNNIYYEYMIDIDYIFDGRESITPKEMIVYFTNKILALQVRNNKNELEAMEMILEDISLEEEMTNTLKMFLIITKIESLIRDLNE